MTPKRPEDFSGNDPSDGAEEKEWERERRDMVEVLRRYGIRDARVLAAMERVRRHAFIPAAHRRHGTGYGDHPWTIGFEQTISQPFIVAYMTERLSLRPGERVLEIGAGSGYQAAVLAELGAEIYTVEVIPELADHARQALAAEGYDRVVHVLTGDGYLGCPGQSPFDAIIATCAPEEVPAALLDQLAEGGRMILPVGGWGRQRLVTVTKHKGRVDQSDDLPVRFVPMVKGLRQ